MKIADHLFSSPPLRIGHVLPVIVGTCLFLLSATGHTLNIRVPSKYPTIQAGIDAASDGDTVLVAPGLYIGEGNRDIYFYGKAVTVKSEKPNQAIIYINGSPDSFHKAFRFTYREGSGTVLDGLKMMGGYGESGGAIWVFEWAKPIIKNCTFTDNFATYGGAIYTSWESEPLIENCTFKDNWASDGGAIYVVHKARPHIKSCMITGNRAIYWGGGIQVDSNSDPLIEGCIICGNGVMQRQYFGGGVSFCNSSGEIRNTQICYNGADLGGGLNISNSYVFINSCLIYGNLAESTPIMEIQTKQGECIVDIYQSTICNNWNWIWAPGMYIPEDAEVRILNSVFWRNGENDRDFLINGGTLKLYCSATRHNDSGEVWDGLHNIFINDPGFVDLWDFRLTEDSPLRGMGWRGKDIGYYQYEH